MITDALISFFILWWNLACSVITIHGKYGCMFWKSGFKYISNSKNPVQSSHIASIVEETKNYRDKSFDKSPSSLQ